uniref:Uncharacterized protein n=1 Tax=Oryza sativa subsp. japonica TaxID=39947 RepID=Q69XE3_ORYSJ|nr:hypothetical protein [Oryza sativa Japonica Group]
MAWIVELVKLEELRIIELARVSTSPSARNARRNQRSTSPPACSARRPQRSTSPPARCARRRRSPPAFLLTVQVPAEVELVPSTVELLPVVADDLELVSFTVKLLPMVAVPARSSSSNPLLSSSRGHQQAHPCGRRQALPVVTAPDNETEPSQLDIHP